MAADPPVANIGSKTNATSTGDDAGSFAVVMHWLSRFFITVKAKMPNLRPWNEVENRLDHCNSGSHNRNQPDSMQQLSTDHLLNWGLNWHFRCSQVTRCRIRQQSRESPDGMPKFDRIRRLFSKRSQMAIDQRVVKDPGFAHFVSPGKESTR